MKVVRLEDVTHSKPAQKDNAFSSSAKIFQTKQLDLYSEKVEPGKKSSAPHSHKAIDEIVVMTKGELYAFEGEESTLLKEGDSICFLANSQNKHYLENQSHEDAEFLLFRKNISQDDVIY
ncbi:MAG: putative cupin superfamily protein [Bacteriovoracaceae bacterium]|jgi:uncharacterized cupin superfamily protein